ncbi:TsaB protein [Candidatus Rhodobacter oscarellae]|uniref:TsaB protein n=1 Tax=Candidatus Rhodobacter oscarellae TaxID=1675527 RepID=A0A0J9E7N4_9RHOB|nr:tRNA (adenosine(37)-N6)-threonylcarbamoyltransferase complex dimerization subunit type 1 TsaB [Candidatus Rhodobacter lobularis]KMW58726.1 TsaB protein [Candidatus Rhodobacter lobularis]
MITLGFDTSGPWCGAALIVDGDCPAARYEDMTKGQAERLMPMLQEVLAEAGAAWGDLDRIGVGIGPGNFTGVRISVSAARGLALGLGVPAMGVTLLEALAYGTEGPVLACLDARRGQGYFQRFGYGTAEPFLGSLDDLEPEPGLKCIGSLGAEAAAHLGAAHAPALYAPGSAIARIAARRSAAAPERPAPLYLRAADAAPPREAPPVILPETLP